MKQACAATIILLLKKHIQTIPVLFKTTAFYQNLGNVRQPKHPFENPVAQNISLCYNNCAGCVLLSQASSHNF